MLRVLLAVILLCIPAAGCTPPAASSAADSHLQAIRSRGSLIMLCWPHQESKFVRRMVEEFGAEGLNKFAGADVDLMTAFAVHLGVALEIKPVTDGYSSLIPALLDGQGDLIASSMTITAGREAVVDFSAPYHEVRSVVVARQGSGLARVEDLHGTLAATVPGSSHQEHLQALGFDDLRFHTVDFMLENYQAVADNEADFALVDSGSAQAVLKRYTELRERLEVAFEFPDPDFYGVALPPDSDLLPALNSFLATKRAAGELPTR